MTEFNLITICCKDSILQFDPVQMCQYIHNIFTIYNFFIVTESTSPSLQYILYSYLPMRALPQQPMSSAGFIDSHWPFDEALYGVVRDLCTMCGVI